MASFPVPWASLPAGVTPGSHVIDSANWTALLTALRNMSANLNAGLYDISPVRDLYLRRPLDTLGRRSLALVEGYDWQTNPQGASAPHGFWGVSSPGGVLAAGSNTITITPVPPGVNGSDTSLRVLIQNGTGAAEICPVTGGTAVAGSASGTLIIICDHAHSGAWAAGSSTQGRYEAGKDLDADAGTMVAILGNWADRGGQVHNVMAYGAKVDGATDDTVAVQKAIDVCRAFGGIAFVPMGTCMVSRLDMTGIEYPLGVQLRGAGNPATKLMPIDGTPSYGTSSGHLIDLTGSGGVLLADFQLGGYATQTSAVPTTGIFVAPSATTVPSKIIFDSVGVVGSFTVAPCYWYGLASSSMRELAMFQFHNGDTSALNLNADNPFSLTSDFITISSSTFGTSNLVLTDCEIHHMGTDGGGTPLAMRNTSNILFQGGNISSNGNPTGPVPQNEYVFVGVGGAHGIKFDTVSFYSDTSTPPVHVANGTAGYTFEVTFPKSTFQYTGDFLQAGGTVILTGNTPVAGPSGQTTLGSPLASGASVYANPAGHTTTDAAAACTIPYPALVCEASMSSSAAPGSGQAFVATLMKNGVATSYVVSISGTNTSVLKTDANVDFAAGDTWSWHCETSGGAATARLSVATTLLPH